MIQRPALILILILSATVTASCSSTTDINAPSIAHPAQKYRLEAVRQRAKDLRPGMSRMEVMIRLGSPAEQLQSTWIYRPEDTGLGILPRDALMVSFRGGVYVSHRVGVP